MSQTNASKAATTARYDIIVGGAGPAGLATAVALARTELDIALCGKLPSNSTASPDTRTAALFTPSIEFLTQIAVWPALALHCAPIEAIRIVDASERLWRAPETLFAAHDVGQQTLGHNCPNPAIVSALVDRIRNLPNITTFFDHQITSARLEPKTAHVELKHDGGTATEMIGAPLIVAADGRRSTIRRASGIGVRSWSNGQSAITAQFAHTRRHRAVSTEFHRRGGPLTVVPLQGDRSALVWVDRQDAVQKLLAQDDATFARTLKEHLNGLLGEVELLTPRRSFELTTQIADRLACNRLVLVGEAAHAFPPIGAQGLNLTLRDSDALLETIEQARKKGVGDLGSKYVCDAYADKRRTDVWTRVYGVDLLGRTLTSTFLPAALTRGAVLHVANAIPLFKRILLEQGAGITRHE